MRKFLDILMIAGSALILGVFINGIVSDSRHLKPGLVLDLGAPNLYAQSPPGAYQSPSSGGGLPVGLGFVSPTLTISSATNGNGCVALSGNTNGAASFCAPASAATTTNAVVMTNALTWAGTIGTNAIYGFSGGGSTNTGLAFASTNTLDFMAGNADQMEISTSIFAHVPICDWSPGTGCLTWTSTLISVTGAGAPIFKATNNTAILTSDFTDSNASGLQVITGLSFALPNSVQKYSFHCSLSYSEATPIASDQFGVASLTTAPTSLRAQSHVITTEGAGASQTTGDSGFITTTTPTSIVTYTPVGTGIKPVEIDGAIETAGGGASTLQFYVTNGTAADVIVIKRDSYCALY